MRLVPISGGMDHRHEHLMCSRCRTFKLAWSSVADLDGEAFRSYICVACLTEDERTGLAHVVRAESRGGMMMWSVGATQEEAENRAWRWIESHYPPGFDAGREWTIEHQE